MPLVSKACADGYDVVLVAGGDGTVNQAAHGLMTAASDGLPLAALGPLASRTANVLAGDLGMPVPGPGLKGTLPTGRWPPVAVNPANWGLRRRAGKRGAG